VCGRCKGTLSVERKPVEVTDATFSAVVERSPLPVLLDLWAPWCGPRRVLAPVLDQLAAELAGRVLFAKLNVDDNPSTAARFGMSSIRRCSCSRTAGGPTASSGCSPRRRSSGGSKG
jgi:thioredoxin-like negative regulator of GroEL